ncbi:hypothetical protein [Roseovarius sp. CH_XMU1461]|uniref:hypothetical protein n=1 Tax=Roseovarius sp. CH_XMU1461 TaxID=3107777 RepID=UPI0030089930
MIDQAVFDARVSRLEDALHKKCGVGGRDLRAKLRRAGRRLPKRVQRAGRMLTEAQARRGIPKLWLQVDGDETDRAFDTFDRHLETVNPVERRKGLALALTGTIVFNLLLVLGFLIFVLKWQDLI